MACSSSLPLVVRFKTWLDFAGHSLSEFLDRLPPLVAVGPLRSLTRCRRHIVSLGHEYAKRMQFRYLGRLIPWE